MDARHAWASTPKKGGKLTFAFNQHGPADTLDPALLQSTLAYIRARSLYGSLVRLTNELSYEPELAEQVIPNVDLTEWTFKLRQGVEFHNGKTLTADDVVYTMNRHIGKDSISKASALVNMVDRWEKVNDSEVRAVLSSPNADLPIALGTFHFKIVPDGHTDFANPMDEREAVLAKCALDRGRSPVHLHVALRGQVERWLVAVSPPTSDAHHARSMPGLSAPAAQDQGPFRAHTSTI